MEIKRIENNNQNNPYKKVYIFRLKFEEFKVEDLKYTKDDPLLDANYSGFV